MNDKQSRIDWNAVRNRLANRLHVDIHEIDRHRFSDILRARAEKLAQRDRDLTGPSSLQNFIVCRLTNERVALAISHVNQVFGRLAVTHVPRQHRDLLGVANIHGALRSIIDLRSLLGLPPDEADGGYFVLIEAGNRLLGLFVEAVEGICDIDAGQLAAPDEAVSDAVRQISIGVTEDRILVIDAARLIEHVAGRACAAEPSAIAG